eukprot:TRINITY_DN17791_c0_g1_i1.p1 TRINITY_DN17791_c0_g1~~TRINITY_DN17791_c0_g1_i1.p1  ORF type:complete len:422 (+),score=31.63 TRINITY_DN17791_c0_g1_i1:218-1483(+)
MSGSYQIDCHAPRSLLGLALLLFPLTAFAEPRNQRTATLSGPTVRQCLSLASFCPELLNTVTTVAPARIAQAAAHLCGNPSCIAGIQRNLNCTGLIGLCHKDEAGAYCAPKLAPALQTLANLDDVNSVLEAMDQLAPLCSSCAVSVASVVGAHDSAFAMAAALCQQAPSGVACAEDWATRRLLSDFGWSEASANSVCSNPCARSLISEGATALATDMALCIPMNGHYCLEPYWAMLGASSQAEVCSVLASTLEAHPCCVGEIVRHITEFSDNSTEWVSVFRRCAGGQWDESLATSKCGEGEWPFTVALKLSVSPVTPLSDVILTAPLRSDIAAALRIGLHRVTVSAVVGQAEMLVRVFVLGVSEAETLALKSTLSRLILTRKLALQQRLKVTHSSGASAGLTSITADAVPSGSLRIRGLYD